MSGLYVFQFALRDLLQVRRLLVWLIVIALIGVLAAYLPSLAQNLTPEDAYVQLAGGLVYKLTALAAAIFTASVVSQEVEQKTIVYLLTRPIPRVITLLARTKAAAIVTLLVGVLALTVVNVAIYGTHAASNAVYYRDLVALTIGSFAYTALFLLVTLLINRSMPVCLLFAFGWENVIPNMPGDTVYVSVYGHLMALAQHPSSEGSAGPLGLLSGAFGTNLIPVSTAWVILVGIVVIGTGLSSFVFSNFEYVPREDTD
ncbi:MAG: hypothetical protein KIS66_04300 [Fimbriimonadaceae bacterium]|nr:hypothetical protein [Fimbriimonadaceae bacterium]